MADNVIPMTSEKTIEAAARLYVELFKDGMHTYVFILRESIRAHERICG